MLLALFVLFALVVTLHTLVLFALFVLFVLFVLHIVCYLPNSCYLRSKKHSHAVFMLVVGASAKVNYKDYLMLWIMNVDG